ncbi:hypothetical protein Sjap_017782 [Stephania japonica]|uniref:Uncharacterized protein n=1 Tax=Stephania japonica TaxID=461633 RepID=A0AAP0I6V0_9MAGN
MALTLPPHGTMDNTNSFSSNIFQIPSSVVFDIGFVTKSDFTLNVSFNSDSLLSNLSSGTIPSGNRAK